MSPEERAAEILRRCWAKTDDLIANGEECFHGLDKEIASHIRAAVAFAQEHSTVPLLMKGMESQAELMDGLKQENRKLKARVEELETAIMFCSGSCNMPG